MEFFTDSFYRTMIGIALGAIVGSFLNVCATRIPKGSSIVVPRSACPACKKPIGWADNIPIISWILLRGVARCCKFSIPIRYIFVEIFTSLFFGLLFFRLDNVNDWSFLVCGVIFVSFLVVVIAIDFETMTIPDRFSVGGAFIGLVLSFGFPSLHGYPVDPIFLERMSAFFTAVVGLLFSSSILYWIGAVAERLMGKEALGQGDVKLLGFVGAFCGWQGGLFVIFGGALIGTLLLTPILICKKFSSSENIKSNQDEVGWGTEVPFGPFLGIAALSYFLGLYDLVDGWFEEIISNFMTIFSVL